jgi:hypothetical protein
MSSGTKKVTPGGVLLAICLISVVQAASLAITEMNAPTYVSIGYSYEPFGTSSAGSVLGVLALVAVVFATTVLLAWIARRRMTLSFKLFVFLATSTSAFILTLITADGVLYRYVDGRFLAPVEILVSLAPVAGIAYTVFVKEVRAVSAAVLGLIAAEVGSYFASTLPLTTAVLLPSAFALYDVYAVFRGPLKQLVSVSPTALGALSVRVGEFTVGMGDLVFYSMLPSLALFYSGLQQSLLVIVSVDLGVAATLYMLRRRRLLPGLPIPIALGLAALLAAGVL